MRRLSLIVATWVLVLSAGATRADAALGFLDRLSGPGKWLTATLETRLKCFGAPESRVEAVLKGFGWAHGVTANSAAIYRRQLLEATPASQGRDDRALVLANIEQLVADSKNLMEQASAQVGTYVETRLELRQALARQAAGIARKAYQMCRAGNTPNCDFGSAMMAWASVAATLDLPVTLLELSGTSIPVPQILVDTAAIPVAPGFIPGAGVRFSFCREKANDQRLFALDVGGTVGWTKDSDGDELNQRFADGASIWLYDIVPTLSWRPVYHLQRARNPLDVGNHSKGDVIDLGAGAGPYWFTSSNLDTVKGAMVELYVEAHVPPALKKPGQPGLWRYLPSVRYSQIGFLGGFNPNDFGPRPIGAEHQADDKVEWVGKWTFFYEVKFVR